MKSFLRLSTPQLIELKNEIEWEIDWRSIQRRVGRREVLGYFVECGGDERHSEYEFHLAFTDGTKERWDFSHSFTDVAKTAMETFRKSFFPTVKETTRETWAALRKEKRK